MTADVWFDDALVPVARAGVSVLDHAFTVGDAVFETMKAVDGVPFALSRHLARLASSARGLGLAPPDEARVRAAIVAVLSQPGIGAVMRVRVTYGGGEAPMGSGRSDARPRLVVVAAEATPWPSSTAVAIVPWVRNERSAVAGLKTTSYAENVVALERAHSVGAGEAIFANTQGALCEGTGSNIFVVTDGIALTPRLSSGCLAGVTRDLVLEWCGAIERDLTLEDLVAADEAFITSSTRDVHPVSAVDGVPLAGAPGPVTSAAMAEFTRRAAQDLDP